MSYIGTEPKDIRSFGRTKFDYTATQGQTAFTGADDDGKVLAFTVGQIEVYVNGILMDDSDFTTTGTGTVTLASAANLNDVVNIVSFETNIPDSNYVPASGGTFTGNVTNSGNVTVGGTLGVTGAVTASNGLTVDDDGATVLTVDRATNEGDIIDVQKDGTSVGSIGVSGGNNMYLSGQANNHAGVTFATQSILPTTQGTVNNNTVDLGQNGNAYKDLWLGGGIYLGGTGSSNFLDDYEEGTWTPNIYKDSSSSSALPVNSRYGYYRKVGGLLWMSFYWYHNGGLSSQTNNSSVWTLKGLPFAVISLTNSGYQFIPAGYIVLSNSTYYEDHRWQANATDTLTLYGSRRQQAHTTGVLEFAATGVLMTDA
tara:strand:+ start:616 stop:1722 length:1107 start_codon:yes stop_codon:yes gene_type:complete